MNGPFVRHSGDICGLVQEQPLSKMSSLGKIKC
jgi:hypothetical protein